jgi:Rieske Fe-S protein
MSDKCGRRGFLQASGCFALMLAATGLSPTGAFAWVEGTQEDNLRRYPVPASDGVSIDRNAQVMLVRVQNEVAALSLACPHQQAAVKWLPADHRFQCTKHDSQYQPDGTYTSGRATRNLDRFPIRKEGSSIVVDVTRVYQSDKDAAGWHAAFVTP